MEVWVRNTPTASYSFTSMDVFLRFLAYVNSPPTTPSRPFHLPIVVTRPAKPTTHDYMRFTHAGMLISTSLLEATLERPCPSLTNTTLRFLMDNNIGGDARP